MKSEVAFFIRAVRKVSNTPQRMDTYHFAKNFRYIIDTFGIVKYVLFD